MFLPFSISSFDAGDSKIVQVCGEVIRIFPSFVSIVKRLSCPSTFILDLCIDHVRITRLLVVHNLELAADCRSISFHLILWTKIGAAARIRDFSSHIYTESPQLMGVCNRHFCQRTLGEKAVRIFPPSPRPPGMILQGEFQSELRLFSIACDIKILVHRLLL